MRIGIYAAAVTPEWGGAYDYTERLISALAKYSSEELVVFTSVTNDSHFARVIENQGVTVVVPTAADVPASPLANKRSARQVVGGVLRRFPPIHRGVTGVLERARRVTGRDAIRPEQWRLEAAKAMDSRADVVHFPFQTQDGFEGLLARPTLITLHDLQHRHFPEFFTSEEYRWREETYPRAAAAATRVIVSFAHVKEDVVNLYGLSPAKVDVCGIGFELSEGVRTINPTEVRAKYGIERGYLLYTASTWEHKNHVRLLRAFRRVLDSLDEPLQLVCTGNKTKYFSVIEQEIARLGLDDEVVFPGRVDESELLALLKGTILSVIPTLYEAGSYPLLEAMALGVPVICSNVTSLPEQIGDGRFIFDPYDVEAMSSLMASMVTDAELRQASVANGLKRAAQFRPRNMVQGFLASYRKAIADWQPSSIAPSIHEQH